MDPNQLPSQYQPATFSMPLRVETKRKRTRAGLAGLLIGLPLIGLGIFGFARGGAEMLGVWGIAVGVLATLTGVLFLKKAARNELG